MANLWGFMKDPDVWPEAEMFRPERFLEESEAGELRLVRHERFVPLDMGRRICMGHGHPLHLHDDPGEEPQV